MCHNKQALGEKWKCTESIYNFKWPQAEKHAVEVMCIFFSFALHCLKFNVLPWPAEILDAL